MDVFATDRAARYRAKETGIVYHGISWYIMVYHGISWYIMVYHGISWYIMVYHGISKIFYLSCIQHWKQITRSSFICLNCPGFPAAHFFLRNLPWLYNTIRHGCSIYSLVASCHPPNAFQRCSYDLKCHAALFWIMLLTGYIQILHASLSTSHGIILTSWMMSVLLWWVVDYYVHIFFWNFNWLFCIDCIDCIDLENSSDKM